MTEVSETKSAPAISEGRIVKYVLSDSDVARIDRNRAEDRNRRGNQVYTGEAFPAIVVRVFPKEYGDQPGVNLQVFLDGSDSIWVTSCKQGYNYLDFGCWLWPERV